eukprot:1197_1
MNHSIIGKEKQTTKMPIMILLLMVICTTVNASSIMDDLAQVNEDFLRLDDWANAESHSQLSQTCVMNELVQVKADFELFSSDDLQSIGTSINSGVAIMNTLYKLNTQNLTEYKRVKAFALITSEALNIVSQFCPSVKVFAVVFKGISAFDNGVDDTRLLVQSIKKSIDKQADRVINRMEFLQSENVFYAETTQLEAKHARFRRHLRSLTTSRSKIVEITGDVLESFSGRVFDEVHLKELYDLIHSEFNDVKKYCDSHARLDLPQNCERVAIDQVFRNTPSGDKDKYFDKYGRFLLDYAAVIKTEILITSLYCAILQLPLQYLDKNSSLSKMSHLKQRMALIHIKDVVEEFRTETEFLESKAFENQMVMKSMIYDKRFGTFLKLMVDANMTGLIHQFMRIRKNGDYLRQLAVKQAVVKITDNHGCWETGAVSMDQAPQMTWSGLGAKLHYTGWSSKPPSRIDADVRLEDCMNATLFNVVITDGKQHEIALKTMYNQWISIDHNNVVVTDGVRHENQTFMVILNDDNSLSFRSKQDGNQIISIGQDGTMIKTRTVSNIYDHPLTPDQKFEFVNVSDTDWNSILLDSATNDGKNLFALKSAVHGDDKYLYFDPQMNVVRIITELVGFDPNGFQLLKGDHCNMSTVSIFKPIYNQYVGGQANTSQFKMIFHPNSLYVSFQDIKTNAYLSIDQYKLTLKQLNGSAITRNESFELIRIKNMDFHHYNALNTITFAMVDYRGKYSSMPDRHRWPVSADDVISVDQWRGDNESFIIRYHPELSSMGPLTQHRYYTDVRLRQTTASEAENKQRVLYSFIYQAAASQYHQDDYYLCSKNEGWGRSLHSGGKSAAAEWTIVLQPELRNQSHPTKEQDWSTAGYHNKLKKMGCIPPTPGCTVM